MAEFKKMIHHVFPTGGRQYRMGGAQSALCGRRMDRCDWTPDEADPEACHKAYTIGGAYQEARTPHGRAKICPTCAAKMGLD